MVKTDKKTRFNLTPDNLLLRANQGHSEEVAKFIDPEKLLEPILKP